MKKILIFTFQFNAFVFISNVARVAIDYINFTCNDWLKISCQHTLSNQITTRIQKETYDRGKEPTNLRQTLDLDFANLFLLIEFTCIVVLILKLIISF